MQYGLHMPSQTPLTAQVAAAIYTVASFSLDSNLRAQLNSSTCIAISIVGCQADVNMSAHYCSNTWCPLWLCTAELQKVQQQVTVSPKASHLVIKGYISVMVSHTVTHLLALG